MSPQSTAASQLSMIEELTQFQQIVTIAQRYRERHGTEPLNVSHWDPSPQLSRQITDSVILPAPENPLPYIYSYTIDLHDDVLRRLGFDPARHACLFTPSGTVAMLCATAWLRSQQANLTAFGPFYFPVRHQAEILGLPFDLRYMRREPTGFRLPAELNELETRALWITNPVYCTGVKLHPDDVARLRAYLETGGTLVLDECLATGASSLGPNLAAAGNAVALYAPHKTLCMNGLKFGIIVFDHRHLEYFDQWADVLYGPLTMTNVAAIKHFLSDNYTTCARSFDALVNGAGAFVERAFHAEGGSLDADALGHFRTAYYPALPASLGLDEDFLTEAAEATGAVFIPGSRNHFDPALGLSFRINLALDGSMFRGAIVRLARFLAMAIRRRAG